MSDTALVGGREDVEVGDGGLSAADRWQPVMLIASIGAGLAIGVTTPGVGGFMRPLVSVGVFVLILLVMLGLDTGALATAARHRRFLFTAVGLNFVLNPLLAWGVSSVFLAGQPDLRVGLMLFLVTPCIGWYLVFTELAGGDVALGVSLLGINVVLQVLLLPVYLVLFVGQAEGVELSSMIRSVLIFLVGPALVASVIRAVSRRHPPLASVQTSIERSPMKTGVLALVIVAMFASEATTLTDNPEVIVRLVPAYIAFFLAAFVLALMVGTFAGLSGSEVVALVFTATSRNSEASLAIAATAFASPLVALTVVAGPIVELPLLVLMVRALRSPTVRSRVLGSRADAPSPQRTTSGMAT